LTLSLLLLLLFVVVVVDIVFDRIYSRCKCITAKRKSVGLVRVISTQNVFALISDLPVYWEEERCKLCSVECDNKQ
jgi:hypothetical protein